MKILPEVTVLPESPFAPPHHSPPTDGARPLDTFRSCLRWEFGFTCSVCMLHLADVLRVAGRGWGILTVEYVVPRAANEDEIHRYSNCVLACKHCNSTRQSRQERASDGARVLNPRVDAWGHRFVWEEHRLVPAFAGDRDAEFTAEAYGVNRPFKVRARRNRAQLVRQYLQTLLRHAEVSARTVRQTKRPSDVRARRPSSRRGAVAISEDIGRLRNAEIGWRARAARRVATLPHRSRLSRGPQSQDLRELESTLRELAEERAAELVAFSAIPRDTRSQRCGCSDSPTLPGWLADQLLELPRQR